MDGSCTNSSFHEFVPKASVLVILTATLSERYRPLEIVGVYVFGSLVAVSGVVVLVMENLERAVVYEEMDD